MDLSQLNCNRLNLPHLLLSLSSFECGFIHEDHRSFTCDYWLENLCELISLILNSFSLFLVGVVYSLWLRKRDVVLDEEFI